MVKQRRDEDGTEGDEGNPFGEDESLNPLADLQKELSIAPPNKKKAVGSQNQSSSSSSDPAMKKLMATMARLSLSTALKARALSAILLHCLMVPAQGAHAKAGRAATKAHRDLKDKLKEEGKDVGHINMKAGPPHLMVYHAFLAAAGLRYKNRGEHEKAQEISDHRAACVKMGHRELGRYVRHFRLAKAQSTTTRFVRLEATVVHATPCTEPWNYIVDDLLQEEGAHELPNLAAPTAMEKELQAFLDDFKEEMA